MEMTEVKPKMKIFISQKMTGRRDGEIRNERWYVSELCKLVYGRPNLEIEIINQYDLPLPEDHYKMKPTQLGITLLGRSISLMNDADLVVVCGNPLESKGMMVELEVLRSYNLDWIRLDQLSVECMKTHTREWLDLRHERAEMDRPFIYGATGKELDDDGESVIDTKGE